MALPLRKTEQAVGAERPDDILRAVIQSAPVAIIGLDLDGNVQHVWNPAAERLLGWSAAEAMGRPLATVPPGAQEEFRGFRERIRAGLTLEGVEVRRCRRDGSPIDYAIYASPLHDASGSVTGNIAVLVDVSEKREALELARQREEAVRREEAARAARLRFAESLDRVNRALQGEPDLDRAMTDVLEHVLSDLGADRAFLLHPCDPDAPSFRVPLERTRPSYPGAGELAADVPMDAGAARVLRTLLEASGPVRFDPATGVPQAEELARRFGYQSSMMVALRPKLGAPWVFGIHQCSHPQVWSEEQEALFREIGWRLQEALTSLLAFRHLQERERELRSLVESFPDLLSRFDLDGRLLWTNPATLRAFGVQAHEILGRRLDELPPAEDRPTHLKLLEAIGAVARDGGPNQLEISWSLPSGARHFEVRHFPETDDTGRIVSVLGIACDVTERKLAEGQVALLTFALDNVRESAFLIDDQARFQYVNEEACRELGYSRAELLSMGVPDIDPDFPLERWRAHWDAVVERGALLFESRHRTRDGHTLPVEISVSHLEFRGRPYNLALVRDITERKAAEQVLLRHAAVIEASDDAIVTKSPEGVVTSWNRGAEILFGYSAAEAVGQPITFLLPEPRVHEEQRILAEIRAGRSVSHYETRRRCKDGRLVDVSVTVSPLLAPDGRLMGISKIARDITSRKQAEAELQRHHDLLEELVAERTAALREANEQLESFSYSVSHDLRTPLRAVDGFSRMLATRYGHLLDDEARRLIRVVRENSARMSKLIDDILAFSHSGRVEMRRAEVDMDRLVEEAWLELEPARAGRSIELERGPLQPARGDPALLRQVWLNLLANAVKFTRPCSRARIEVGGSVAAAETAYYVTDNGVGFDAAYGHKLFGAFERLHGVDEFEGTGIGLAIVKRIVARHGGRVWAESRPGEGATFHFSLGSGED